MLTREPHHLLPTPDTVSEPEHAPERAMSHVRIVWMRAARAISFAVDASKRVGVIHGCARHGQHISVVRVSSARSWEAK